MEPTLTNEEYVASPGGLCPFCKSGDIEGGPVEIDGGTAWQALTCNDCHHNWQDTYRLQGYTIEFSEQPEDEPEDDGKTYEIVRFRFKGENEVIKGGLTLAEAQAHCELPTTRGDGWFDGYREE